MTQGASGSADLDARYGRARQRGIDRRLGWLIAGLALAGGLAVLVFGGWQQQSALEYRTISYAVVDERTVRVTVEVSAPQRSEVACSLEALSTSYATVGWRLLQPGPSDNLTRRFDVTLVTTAPATTGTVRSCWLLEGAEAAPIAG